MPKKFKAIIVKYPNGKLVLDEDVSFEDIKRIHMRLDTMVSQCIWRSVRDENDPEDHLEEVREDLRRMHEQIITIKD